MLNGRTKGAAKMNETLARELVAESGRMLLQKGLAARTWGNISCRTGDAMVITPSGLGYENMTPEDTVTMDMRTGERRGSRKPSSEKGIHLAAYAAFPEADFVIHTHQTYASAISLAGFRDLSLTSEEREALGGAALAEYGLPGTKKLAENVAAAYASGAHTVLMARHGAVIAGRGREETFRRAELLETVCRRACRGLDLPVPAADAALAGEIMSAVRREYPFAVSSDAAAALICAQRGSVYAQLDDMAQMIGGIMPRAQPDGGSVLRALRRSCAVLVPGVGAVCRAENEGDLAAVRLLAEKACVCRVHTRELGLRCRLPLPDVLKMRNTYLKKYSKQAAG